MGLRPGHCYATKKHRAYSRYAVRVHRRNYIGAIPGLKTRQFNMGNPTKDFSHILDLVVNEHKQIRDNAIESSRIIINRYLVKKLGKDGFFMRIRVYPHQVLRENKMAQGAHADRIQTGMSKAFGKPVGKAVRVRPGQKIISVLVDEEDVGTAKKALLRAKARMNCKLQIRVGTDIESIGTRPKKIREIIEEVPEKAEEEEKEEEVGEKEEEGEKKEEEKGKGEKGAEKKEEDKEEKKGEKKK